MRVVAHDNAGEAGHARSYEEAPCRNLRKSLADLTTFVTNLRRPAPRDNVSALGILSPDPIGIVVRGAFARPILWSRARERGRPAFSSADHCTSPARAGGKQLKTVQNTGWPMKLPCGA
jgi:hypothetical protein